MLKTMGHTDDIDRFKRGVHYLALNFNIDFLQDQILNFGKQLHKCKNYEVLEEFLWHIIEIKTKVKAFDDFKSYLRYFKFKEQKAEEWSESTWKKWWARVAVIMKEAFVKNIKKHNTLLKSPRSNGRYYYYVWNGSFYDKISDNTKNLDVNMLSGVLDPLVPYILETYPLNMDSDYWRNESSVGRSNQLARAIWPKLQRHIPTIPYQVFDRNGYQFHGRVKALADGAREGGLKL